MSVSSTPGQSSHMQWLGAPPGESVVHICQGEPDWDNVATTVYYTTVQGEETQTLKKTTVRLKLHYRPKLALDQIQTRKSLPRFGAAKGAVGPERGTTMIAPDEFMIEDPTSIEAQQTGEEKMIERLKNQVKHRTRSPVPAMRYGDSSTEFRNELSPAKGRATQRRSYNTGYQNRSQTPPNRSYHGGASPARYRNGTPTRKGTPHREHPHKQKNKQ